MNNVMRALVLVAGLGLLAACASNPPVASPRPVTGGSADPGPDQAAATLPQAASPQIEVAGSPVLGAPDAPVTVVEFIDYECPYCQGFARDTFPQLQARYIDTGKVRYIARDFPLPRHSRARPAAIAAACAGEQGQFWQMHDALLTDGRLGEADIAAQVQALRLDVARFNACRAEARHAARLDAGLAAARALGVRGTPSFLVGASAGGVARGQLLKGNADLAAFEKVIGRYLEPAAIDTPRH